MISVSDVSFPNNIILALKTELEKIGPPSPPDDLGIPVLLRPMRKGDPTQCIGLTAGLWTPQEESYEMNGPYGQTGATVNNYLIGIQAFIQHTDEEEGLAISSTLSGVVRSKLMFDNDVRAGLAGLVSTEFGYRERFMRGSIQGQRFMSNEISGSFYHLSNLEFIVETEISPI